MGFFWFKSDFLFFFVQASNITGWQIVQMLYDDVINDKDYVGFKVVTEDREFKQRIKKVY